MTIRFEDRAIALCAVALLSSAACNSNAPGASATAPLPASHPAIAPVAAAQPVVAVATPGALHVAALAVDGSEGRNNFTAVFDAPLGERITASSSQVQCDVTYDEKANAFSGSCSVPLSSIMVDNDSTKADHFQQWSTNKKSDPKTCRFEARFDNVKVNGPIVPGTPAAFAADVPFSICGRARVDGGKEHVTGNVLLVPDSTLVRVRAEVDGFSRENYHIGPAYTEGWLARVQKLAPVVADAGNITLSLFASPK